MSFVINKTAANSIDVSILYGSEVYNVQVVRKKDIAMVMIRIAELRGKGVPSESVKQCIEQRFTFPSVTGPFTRGKPVHLIVHAPHLGIPNWQIFFEDKGYARVVFYSNLLVMHLSHIVGSDHNDIQAIKDQATTWALGIDSQMYQQLAAPAAAPAAADEQYDQSLPDPIIATC